MTQQEQAPGPKAGGRKQFRRGFLDGVPIGLGYFSVSIAFGILCAVNGMDIRATVLISMTNLTSAGQLGRGRHFRRRHAAGNGPDAACHQPALCADEHFAFSKLHKSVRFADRLWVSFFITDEIFAVSASSRVKWAGAILWALPLCPYLGWALGTLAGLWPAGCCPKVCKAPWAWRCMACLAIVVPAAKAPPPRAGCGGAGGCA